MHEFPTPDSKASLQRFLGMTTIASCLNWLRSSTPYTRRQIITWTPDCEIAFDSAKSALASATLLHHPHSTTATTSITVDASDKAVGGQLEQLQTGIWRLIAFFSRKLSAAERKYSAFDRELLAIYLAIKHFRHFVEGRVFRIYTDHKSWTFAFASAAERSPRQTRHLSLIAEFSMDMCHIEGKANVVADTLSRANGLSVIALPTIDYRRLANDQVNSDEIAAYKTSTTSLHFANWGEPERAPHRRYMWAFAICMLVVVVVVVVRMSLRLLLRTTSIFRILSVTHVLGCILSECAIIVAVDILALSYVPAALAVDSRVSRAAYFCSYLPH